MVKNDGARTGRALVESDDEWFHGA
jgi:hypothetical protein